MKVKQLIAPLRAEHIRKTVLVTAPSPKAHHSALGRHHPKLSSAVPRGHSGLGFAPLALNFLRSASLAKS